MDTQQTEKETVVYYDDFEDRPATRPLVATVRQTAEMLQLSRDTVERLVEKGELEGVQLSERRKGVTMRSILRKVHHA